MEIGLLQRIQNQAITYVSQAIKARQLGAEGLYIDLVEEWMQSYFNRDIVLVDSGSSALLLSLWSAGVEAGDHVVCLNYNFPAVVNAINLAAAKPLFVEPDLHSHTYSSGRIDEFLDDFELRHGFLPRALIWLNPYGYPRDMHLIASLKQKGIVVIEDAAGSFGSRYNGQLLGTFGDYGVLSFNANKVATGGGGGLVLFPEGHKKLLTQMANQGRNLGKQHMVSRGFNFMISNMQAALLWSYLECFEEILDRKLEIHNIYQQEMNAVGLEGLWVKEDVLSCPNYWMSIVSNVSLKSASNYEEVGLRRSYVELNPSGKEARQIRDESLVLPSQLDITHQQVRTVCQRLKAIIVLGE